MELALATLTLEQVKRNLANWHEQCGHHPPETANPNIKAIVDGLSKTVYRRPSRHRARLTSLRSSFLCQRFSPDRDRHQLHLHK
jgi:hypothetical protein